MTSDTATALDLARKVLRTEAAAILGLLDRIDANFERAVQLLFECRGRVIVTGMGKSGIICRKIAATLSSTGTSAWFLHPAEATHGDLGAIREDDIVIALSHSGETEEILRLLQSIRRLGARLIALTDPASTLAKAADVTLDCSIAKEACPLNLVPTASTTAALAMGDALAMTLLVRKGFGEDQFASLHPAGKLGRRLARVENVMVSGDAAPVVRPSTKLMPEVFREMSNKRLGMTAVVDDNGRLVGIFTDGDLRRLIEKSANVLELTAGDVMKPNPITIRRDLLAVEALRKMETHKITSIIVTDERGTVDGVVHLHDLWRLQMF